MASEERSGKDDRNTGRTNAAESFALKHLRLLTLAVSAVGAMAMINATRVGGFRDDDFYLIGLGQEYGFGRNAFLGKPEFFEHLAPSAYGLSWLMGVFGPHWQIAVGLAAVCIAVLTVLVVAIVRELAGSALVALAAGAVIATSIVYEATALWWSTESQQLVMICFAAATALLSLKWIKSKSRAVFASAVLGQAVSCSFYDRAQILPVIILLLLTVATPGSDSLTRASYVKRAREAAPLVAALFAVALLQLVITLSLPGLNAGNLSTAAKVSPGEWWDVVVDWWGIGVGSAVWNQFPVAFSLAGRLSADATVGGLVALVVLAVATIRNRRSAAIWVAAISVITLSGIQVAALRVGVTGSAGLALIARYQELTMLIFATFIPAAWVAAGRPTPRSGLGAAALAAVATLATVGWIAHLLNGLTVQQVAPIRAASYAKNFKSSLERWNASGKRTTFLDQRVPDAVVFRVPPTENFDYYSKASRILAPGVDAPPPNSPSGVLLTADPRGTLSAVNLGVERKIGPSQKTCETSQRTAGWLEPGGVVVPAKIPKAIATSGRAMVLSVALSKTTGEGQIFITSSLSSWPTIELAMDAYPNGLRTLLPAGSKNTTVQFWLGAGGCIDSIKVAEIR